MASCSCSGTQSPHCRFAYLAISSDCGREIKALALRILRLPGDSVVASPSCTHPRCSVATGDRNSGRGRSDLGELNKDDKSAQLSSSLSILDICAKLKLKMTSRKIAKLNNGFGKSSRTI
ncbi:hypothetical protein J6590_038030 [Homalodisca vitripennis]|nr:hypothetical protein J6590_038030 [Homalodisca vitripennis]